MSEIRLEKRNIKKLLVIIFSVAGLVVIITTIALIIMNTRTDSGG